MATFNTSSSVNPNTTPYDQRLTRFINNNFGDKPYQGSARRAPANIYGGQSQSSPFSNASAGMAGSGTRATVHGANLQPDIPGHVPAAGGMVGGVASALRRPAYAPNVPLTRPAAPQPAVTNTTAPQVAQAAQAPQQPPKNPGDAYQITQAAADAAKMGDGGVHDQSVEAGKQRVNDDLQRRQNSENPQAVHDEIINDPWYANNSMWKGIFNAAAATMDGATVSQAYQAGMQGIEQGQQEETRNQMKQNAIQNRDQLLQNYTSDSVANYMITGDASQLREKKLTQAELDQRAKAEKEDQRNYEQSLWERGVKREDEKAKTAAEAEAKKPGDVVYVKGQGMFDKKKREFIPGTGPGADGGTAKAGETMSIAERNEYVSKTGLDPITQEPLKAPQVKASSDWVKNRDNYEAQASTLDDTINNVEYMISPDHESDFNSAFGYIDQHTKTTRKGTSIMEGKIETLKSQLFLNSIKEMKGMGALSDAEGKKLANAISALDENNQGALKSQLNDIYSILNSAKKRMNERASREGYNVGALSNRGNGPESSGGQVATSLGF